MWLRFARGALALSGILAASACVAAGRAPGGRLTPGRARWVANHVQRVRGLELPASAPVDVESRRELAARYEREALETLGEGALARRVRADRALGLLPEGFAPSRAPFTMADLGVAGAYDPETKRIVLVGDLEGGAADDPSLAHEMVHALDDAHFDLVSIRADAKGNTDRALAVLALIEGSAMASTFDVVLSEIYDDVNGWLGGTQVSRAIDDLESDFGLLARTRDKRAREILRATPAYLRERIVFPYARGLAFARALRGRRGTASINAAFRDPPRSTEQVLHPSKLADRRDDPVIIALETGWLGGAVVHEDTLGELGIRQALRNGLGEGRARDAAEGWGGDRYRVVEDAGVDVLLWHTEWDDEREAREFAKLADEWLAERHGAVPHWRSELGFDDLERRDGRVAQIRRRGLAVAIADGAPAGSDWADRLLAHDAVERPPAPQEERRSLGESLLRPLVGTTRYADGSGVRVLAGLLASQDSREESSSFSLLGGTLFDTRTDADGSRTSILLGLISWRTAPREELTRVRVGVSAYACDYETESWALLPIVQAPAASRAPGSRKLRLGLANFAEGYAVDFDAEGTPHEGEAVRGDTSFLLGLVGRAWTDDRESDGTPYRRSYLYGPFQILLSHDSQTLGPLGPRYAPPPPESGPASRPAPDRLERPGDVDALTRWQVLGELLAAYESRTLRRGDAEIASRGRWSALFGLIASSEWRDASWAFATPLLGWMSLPEGRYLTLLWGSIPIRVGDGDAPPPPPGDTAPARGDDTPASAPAR